MGCPYRGLLPFEEKDTEFFFGRDRFLYGGEGSKSGLIKAVQTQPLVVVIGPSGSGKSSVVSAGLIPQLRTEGIWLIDSFRPKNQPFEQLAAVLVPLLEPGLDRIQQLEREIDLASMMRRSLTLSKAASKILEANSGKQRLLLVIDQFEEIYTSCSSEKQSRQFIDLLLDAVSVGNLTLVLTLRADFYGHVLSYPRFGNALQQFTPQSLSSMNREELQSSIEKPLKKSGVLLEPGLTQRILDDVGEEPGNLPLLEFALAELWNKRQNEKLTHRAYDEIGGVKKSIANHAEKVYEQLDELQKKQVEYIFTQLVYPRQGIESIRRVATRSEIGDENWNLVNYLTNYRENSTGHNSRLLVTGWDERKKTDIVEIVHEALIREWKDLQNWISRDHVFRTWQEFLRNSIQIWENEKRDKSALLRGKLLRESEKWLKQKFNSISPLEKEFIQRSRQKERLTRHGIVTLVLTLFSLLIIAQREYAESHFQEQFSAVLIGSSANPNQIPVLQKALQRANQRAIDKDIVAAIEIYKNILRAAQNFESASRAKGNKLQSSNLRELEKVRETAETLLADVIRDNYTSKLKEQLSKGQFGVLQKDAKLDQFENQFTDSLKTTYTILMRQPGLGADKNRNGRLDLDEIIFLPCKVLEDIEISWRSATKGNCGFYGTNIYEAPNCKDLSKETLSFILFDPIDGIETRIRQCPRIKSFNP
ncbi:MAG: AAA family ATPase [Myxacorys chilensis ATA2-1-KO14]|nr:AAA family ATPase [Myxacorys chilensis ATA2-1-KO14]